MKKSLVALAALAVAGVASAQSSVTLFGIVDASVSHVTNKSDLYVANPLAPANIWLPGSLKASKTGLNNSAYNSSRLGFRGVEDLGGGLAASFWLEAALNNDEGTGAATGGGLNFQRRSTVSLSGNFGEVRLGRDYKPTFWNFTIFDPFGTNGTGTALIQRAAGGLENSNVRASNSVGYFLPKNLGGFYGQVMFGFHEKTKLDNGLQGRQTGTQTVNGVVVPVFGDDNSRGDRYWGGRFGYANGPLDVALAYGETVNSSSWNAGTDLTSKNINVGASYDLGVVKLFGQYANIKRKNDFNGLASAPSFNPATKLDGYLFGVTAPVGAGLIRASYGHVKVKTDVNPTLALNPFFQATNPKADQLSLGYVHNLSKRTALYATATYIKNKNGANYSAGSGSITAPVLDSYTAAVGGATGVYRAKTSLGYDFGVRHSF